MKMDKNSWKDLEASHKNYYEPWTKTSRTNASDYIKYICTFQNIRNLVFCSTLLNWLISDVLLVGVTWPRVLRDVFLKQQNKSKYKAHTFHWALLFWPKSCVFSRNSRGIYYAKFYVVGIGNGGWGKKLRRGWKTGRILHKNHIPRKRLISNYCNPVFMYSVSL